MLNGIYASFSAPKLSDDVRVRCTRSLQQLHHLRFVLLNKCDYCLAIILRNVFGLIFRVPLLYYGLYYLLSVLIVGGLRLRKCIFLTLQPSFGGGLHQPGIRGEGGEVHRIHSSLF